MAAVVILDLLYACFDHPRSVVRGLYTVQNLVGIGRVECYASLA